MAVAISLLPYMWKAWWRKLEQKGVWHGANTTMVMGMAFFGFIGIMVGSIVAIKSMRGDSFAQGLMILEANLSAVMMGWFLIPIMVGSTTAEGRGLQPTRMGQFPLSNFDLVSIGLMSRLVQPVYWILLGASLMALLPLLACPSPVLGSVAGLLFLVFSSMLAWSVELFSSALFTSRRGREMMMVLALLLSIPFFGIIMGDFSTTDGEIFFSLGDRSVLLFNEDGSSGLLTQFRFLSPSVWVSSTAEGHHGLGGLFLVCAAAVLSSGLALFSLRRVMLHPPSSLGGRKSTGRPIGVPRFLSSEVGPMVVKELRYLTRTLDHLMGVSMGLIGLAWILIRPDHALYVLPLGVMNIVFNESAIPLNNFGLDGPGADRYRLLPLSGRQIILAKNLAYFMVVAVHIAPLILAGLLKGEAMLALVTILATMAVCLLTTVGGNMASINSPALRAFFNFDSKEQTGGTLALILAALLWLLPVGVYFAMAWMGTWWSPVLGMAVLAGIALLVYRATLSSAGQQFEQSSEKMRERLSKA